MDICILEKSELAIALDLVWEVFQAYEEPDYSEQGVREFRSAISDPEFIEELTMYGAYESGQLAGVLATRSSGTHIALFFVKGAYHRQGIGRALFKRAATDMSGATMTVNSSPYAAPVYRKLGFRELGQEQVVNGMRFIPMLFEA